MRPSTRQHTPGARRRRAGALVAALLLAAALGAAGCSASSGSDSAGSDAAAPAAGGARSEAQTGADGGSGADGGAVADGAGRSDGKAASAPQATSGTGKAPALAPTYLVRTAELSVRTAHVEDALLRARTLAAAAGGYAGDEDTAVDAQGHATSTIQLRVPPAAYDGLLDDLAGLGTLLGRKVGVDDVTGQVVDVQSRIKSQQASVDRVRKLMDQASGLSDVVSLESELSSRESALESLEAQQASLRAQADLATVTLRLSEPPVKAAAPKAPEKKDGFWETVGDALGGGWHAFTMTVRTVLVVLSAVLPFLALAVLAWVAWRLARRWWPRTEAAGPPSSGLLPGRPSAPGPRGEDTGQDREPQGADPWAASVPPAAPPQASPPGQEQGPSD
jgi:hypothetical protein